MSKVRTGSKGHGHSFSQIATAEIPRSTFDRSSTLKTTFLGNELIPIFCDEILPGDTINLRQRSFIRLQTLHVPAMEEITVDTQYFFVPLRTIWTLYPRFMGAQENPDDSIDFTVPQMTTPGGAATSNSLSAHLGIPIQGTDIVHSSLFHRAYAKIWNDWYRDANLQDKIVLDLDAGPDDDEDYTLQKRGKRKDYFTSCLPWPQRGDPINLIFDGIVPVLLTSGAIGGSGAPEFDVGSLTDATLIGDAAEGDNTSWSGSPGNGTATWGTDTNLTLTDLTGEADLTAASANTINGLRNAFSVQRLLERDARGGARLTEILSAHFRVTSPDARLQRAEYIGGTSTVVQVAAVEAKGGGGFDPGELGAKGTGIGRSSAILYSATEHGIVMAMCSGRAPLSYQQGLHRKFTRFRRYDYFWPAFSHVGELPVYDGEIFATGTADRDAGTGDFAVFGYNEAWSSYRYSPNRIGGKFLSEDSVPLDVWHLAIDFSSLPTLDASFIEDDTPFERVMLLDTPHFLADFAFDLKHTRPLPTFSTPGLIDHF